MAALKTSVFFIKGEYTMTHHHKKKCEGGSCKTEFCGKSKKTETKCPAKDAVEKCPELKKIHAPANDEGCCGPKKKSGGGCCGPK